MSFMIGRFDARATNALAHLLSAGAFKPLKLFMKSSCCGGSAESVARGKYLFMKRAWRSADGREADGALKRTGTALHDPQRQRGELAFHRCNQMAARLLQRPTWLVHVGGLLPPQRTSVSTFCDVCCMLYEKKRRSSLQ